MKFRQTSLFAIGVAGRAALGYMAVGMVAGISAFAFTANNAGAIFNSYTKASRPLKISFFVGDEVTSLKFLWVLKSKLETPYVVSYFFNGLLGQGHLKSMSDIYNLSK